MLIDQALSHHRRYSPEKIALRFEGGSICYRELDLRVDRCVNVLTGLGVAPGDRVAVITDNHPDFVVLVFAAARRGAVLVPLNYRLAVPELLSILDAAEPRVLVGELEFLEPLLDTYPGLERRCSVLSLGERVVPTLTSFDRSLQSASDQFRQFPRSADAPVLLQYTSGTTGKPKGVISTHRAWAQISLIEPPLKGIGSEANYLLVMPMCHTGGAKWVVQVLFAGARLTIARRFGASECLETIAIEQITNTTLAPTMLYQLLDTYQPTRDDLSSLNYINYGGGPMSKRRLEQAIETIGCKFTQGYGMTELAGGSVTFAAPEDHVLDGVVSPKFGSVGRPLIDCEVKLIDDAGNSVSADNVGEILVRSDRVTPRYWEGDAPPVDDDGFYHTGDLGRMDEDGYVTIVDRAKDMIVSGGLNIYSREVEDVLLRHPAISEAYVLGLPDETWGETVKAIIVVREGADLTAEEARDWCRQHLASYKKPRMVAFASAEQLPRTALGKVVKRKLRDF